MPVTTPTALWTLTGTPDDVRSLDAHDHFDHTAYSLMKHGDGAAIHGLGVRLGRHLLHEHGDELLADAVPVFPVAYLAVPPACWYLASEALAVVDDARASRGLPPGRLVHVRKDSVTAGDYAASSEQQRRAELAGIGFEVRESLAGCVAVVVDDVRVTGLAEQTIVSALSSAEPVTVLPAYVAVCTPQLAAAPYVERVLNHTAVESPLDLLPAIEADRFCLTIRFLKFALASPDLAEFVARCPQPVLLQMYDGVLATGAAFADAYAPGVATLRAGLGEFRYALARLHPRDTALPGEDSPVGAASYSRFKHGSGSVAARFARLLAQQYADHHDLSSTPRVWVTGSGYAAVPPAAAALVAPFVAALAELVPGLQVRELRVHRSGRTPGDYAAMSPADRDAALRDDCMYVEDSVDLRGELVVALDDIRVTGTHERAMNACLTAAGARWIDHLYLVDAAAFATAPQLESMLNAAAVEGLDDLLAIVRADDFVPNARVCRRVLRLPPEELVRFVEQAPPEVLRWVGDAIEADHLADVEQFADGVRRLRGLAAIRH
nr:phosphoribosyltransferase family protein [Allobranchiibius sp. GilTou38]